MQINNIRYKNTHCSWPAAIGTPTRYRDISQVNGFAEASREAGWNGLAGLGFGVLICAKLACFITKMQS